MVKVTLKIASLSLCLLFGLAQTSAAQNCVPIYESYTTLPAPLFNDYSEWSVTWGSEEFDNIIQKSLPLPNGNILALATKKRLDQSGVGPALYGTKLIALEMNKRGRIDNLHTIDIGGIESIDGFVQVSEGFVALLSRKTQKSGLIPTLVFLKKDGSFLRSRDISGSQNMQTSALFYDERTQNLYALLNTKRSDHNAAALFRMNKNGEVIKKRFYPTGLDNTLHSIGPGPAGSLMATGVVETRTGYHNGWVMRLTPDGSIIWQRPYGRGAAARLKAQTMIADNRIIVAGQVVSANDDKGSAGWVMMIEPSDGDIIWQRYFASDDIHYSTDFVIPQNEKTVISAVMTGKPLLPIADALQINIQNQHAGLLDLDLRGNILSRKSYTNRDGAHIVSAFTDNNNSLVLAGTIKDVFTVYKDDEILKEHTLNGWVMAAPGLKNYQDLCIVPKSEETVTSPNTPLFP